MVANKQPATAHITKVFTCCRSDSSRAVLDPWPSCGLAPPPAIAPRIEPAIRLIQQIKPVPKASKLFPRFFLVRSFESKGNKCTSRNCYCLSFLFSRHSVALLFHVLTKKTKKRNRRSRCFSDSRVFTERRWQH